MTRASDEVGLRGEREAALHLEANGYRVVARRLRTHYGEFDIVATRGTWLVFVEVKTRRSSRFGPPALAVDARRQSRLRNAANHLIERRREWRDLMPRIDVVEVLVDDARGTQIRHLEDAVGV